MTSQALFLGVGIDSYATPALEELPRAVEDVRALAGRLGPAFDGAPLENPSAKKVHKWLRGQRNVLADGGSLFAVWSGHGQPSALGTLRLLTADADDLELDGLSAEDLVAACVRTGASQILIVLDTCYSGAANVDIARVASTLLQSRPPEGQHVWVGVLAACLPLERARDGLLASELGRLLERGPVDSQLRVEQWSPHNELIRGEDLVDALMKEWTSEAQTPQFLRTGSAWGMLPNPLYRPSAQRGIVEHLLLAARGGAGPQEVSAFTGRRAEVDDVVQWVTSGSAGIYVVTGPAGAGKSAVVGRVVSLADPPERARLLAEEMPGDVWERGDPGEGAVHAHVHARRLTADRIANLLGRQLVERGMLRDLNRRRWNAALLVGAIQQQSAERDWRTPVLVIDGLDEARGQVFTTVDELLNPLSRYATIVVATRQVPSPDARPDLLERLAPAENRLDLDEVDRRDRGRLDVREYLQRRLTGVSPAMDPAQVADQFEATMSSDQPFLLARIVADQLRAQPVDTTRHGWRDHVAASYQAAFEADLARVRPPKHRELPAELTPPALARQLLAALTWGYGGGFPEDEWVETAQALAPDAGITRDDISWVLENAGRYVVQDGEAGVAVYRVSHQALADWLRDRFVPSADEPFDLRAAPVATALLNRYAALLRAGVPMEAATYLWRYAWRHVAACGPEQLDQLHALAAEFPELQYDVALADDEVAEWLCLFDRSTQGLALTERAVRVYRDLAQRDPAFEGNLAHLLGTLADRYRKVGRADDALPVTQEAVTIFSSQVGQVRAFQHDLAQRVGTLAGLAAQEMEQAHASHAAYSTDSLTHLAGSLVSAGADELRDLFAKEREQVLQPELAELVTTLAMAEQGIGSERVLSLVRLAGSGLEGAALDAIDDPSRFPALLQGAATAPGATATQALAELAELANRTATGLSDPSLAAIAQFYLAVDLALHDDLDAARGRLRRARELDPGQRDAWMQCLILIAHVHHGPALALLQTLIEQVDGVVDVADAEAQRLPTG